MKSSVSIVMPLYNKEREVARAIRSVLAQSLQNFELIVVNDGSTDTSVEQVRLFDDVRIRLIEQPNQGVSAARNRGVADARSDLVAFLDADDEWLPDFLSTILGLHRKYPDAKILATSYLMRSHEGSQRQAILRRVPEDFHEGILDDYFLVAVNSDPPVCSSAVTVDKNALKSIGGFPLGIRCGEDLLTWARLACKFSIAYSREPLVVFWEPAHVFDRAGRFDDVGDPVGYELCKLYHNAPAAKRKGIRAYLTLWHRMRAILSLQLGKRVDCLRSVGRSIGFGGLNPRIIVIGLLAILPYPRPARIFQTLKRVIGRKTDRKALKE